MRPLIPPRSWRSVLGAHYNTARQQLVDASGKLRASPSEWANLIDTFIDLFLDVLHRHDGALGDYQCGKPGSVLHGGGRLPAQYPVLAGVFKSIHELRRHSLLSHAYVKSTDEPTRRITYDEVQQAARDLKLALAEAAQKW